MATDKRERQRQNRASKQAELTKQQRKQKTIDTAKRVGIWAGVFAVVVVLANFVWA
jgi:hypothetical protein